MFKRLTSQKRIFISAMLAFMLLGTVPAHADVLVAPTRITLEPGQRVGQVNVMNRGREPVTLRISFINYEMQSNGGLKQVDEPSAGAHFAASFLRYSPRRVQLQPGESQVVRVLARPPKDADGVEYRSHLRFQTEPPVKPRSQPGQRESTGFNIELTPLYGVSIPVIVRTGKLQASASIKNIRLGRDANGPKAEFELARRGNRSVYGDFRATFIPDGGKPRVVGLTRGVAVYPPLKVREVRLPLGENLSKGRLRIEYLDNGDNRKVLAASEREIR